jgi:hypothetical protein
MDADAFQDIVLRQIDSAARQVYAQLCRGENADTTRALLRSLHHSLEVFATGVDPDRESMRSFVLLVAEDGDLLLRRSAQLVSVRSSYFDTLLRKAGIELCPGQVLLVDPDFARRALEESLGETAAAQAALDKRKAELTTALRQSSGAWRDELLQEQRRLVARGAELLLRKIELSDWTAAA